MLFRSYCCLYGNSEDDVIIRHIERDAAYEEELIALEGIFWNEHVLKQVPPPYTEDGDLVSQSGMSFSYHRSLHNLVCRQIGLSLIFCPLSSLYLELLVLINNHECIVLRAAGNP